MEKVKVIFRKTRDGEVVAFFPDTYGSRDVNPGMIMSYAHVGQHGEASIGFYQECRKCDPDDYRGLLAELNGIYDDCELVVRKRISYRR